MKGQIIPSLQRSKLNLDHKLANFVQA